MTKLIALGDDDAHILGEVSANLKARGYYDIALRVDLMRQRFKRAPEDTTEAFAKGLCYQTSWEEMSAEEQASYLERARWGLKAIGFNED